MSEEQKQNQPNPTSVATNNEDDGTVKTGEKAIQERPHKRPKLSSKRVDPEVLAVRRSIQQCCAKNDLATALEVYQDALQKSIRIEAQTFYSLLNLCDGLDHSKVHIGTPKPYSDNSQTKSDDEEKVTNAIRDVDLEKRKQSAFEIKERMDELKLPLNETAYTALVKMLSKSKEVELAESIIQEAEKVQQCRVKLRLYSSLLVTYCEMGKLLPALKLWERLSKQELDLTEREYAAIIDCCVATGHADVMEKVLSDVAEEVLVPSRSTCQLIAKWFQSPFANESASTNPQLLLNQVKLPAPEDFSSIGRVQCEPGQKWAISKICHIDAKTGILQDGCMKGLALKPVQVSSMTWDDMMKMNETIVVSGKLDDDKSRFQGGKKGKKRKVGGNDQEERAAHWKAFKDYLTQRGNQFDIIIDGANVGYYKQNFAGAPKHVDYYQIDSVVKHFLRENKKVLLVLHQRHFAHFLMPKKFKPLEKAWMESGVLYKTPAGMNDDWFWLHAALLSGPRALVLTNDEMRDHHFQMLAPRSFLRWRERHQVHFCFGGKDQNEDGNNGGNGRSVILTYPDIYSRRIQRVRDGFVVPHPKLGDENRFLDGMHVADKEIAAPEETYLCVRPVAADATA